MLRLKSMRAFASAAASVSIRCVCLCIVRSCGLIQEDAPRVLRWGKVEPANGVRPDLWFYVLLLLRCVARWFLMWTSCSVQLVIFICTRMYCRYRLLLFDEILFVLLHALFVASFPFFLVWVWSFLDGRKQRYICGPYIDCCADVLHLFCSGPILCSSAWPFGDNLS